MLRISSDITNFAHSFDTRAVGRRARCKRGDLHPCSAQTGTSVNQQRYALRCRYSSQSSALGAQIYPAAAATLSLYHESSTLCKTIRSSSPAHVPDFGYMSLMKRFPCKLKFSTEKNDKILLKCDIKWLVISRFKITPYSVLNF